MFLVYYIPNLKPGRYYYLSQHNLNVGTRDRNEACHMTLNKAIEQEKILHALFTKTSHSCFRWISGIQMIKPPYTFMIGMIVDTRKI